MSDFNALKLLTTVSGFKLLVRANRFGCRTDFAREIHDNLTAKLDAFIAELRDDMRTERELAAARGTPNADALHEMFQLCWPVAGAWLHLGSISLLDPVKIFVEAEGEHEVCLVGLDEYETVPAAELEGLDEIIRAIRTETGITFVVARVQQERRA